LSKAPSISLTKLIEATKLHPRTGLSLGQPPVSVPYGALVEPVSSERDRERFKYLGELFECKRELFLSATGGVGSTPEEASEPSPVSAPGKVAEPEPSGPRLHWGRLNSSDMTVRRAAVPGGWLVAASSGVTFLPDPKHSWDGGSVE
jgi:hypothetical protein